jgi:hypothetical protein
MVDLLPDSSAGWKNFSDLFLAAFTSSTETFDLRDQLKHFVWIPDKNIIKGHIHNMRTIEACQTFSLASKSRRPRKQFRQADKNDNDT